MRALRVLLLLSVTAALPLGAAALCLYQWWQRPLPLADEGLVLQLAPGEGLGRLTARLADKGVLGNPRLLNLTARITGVDQQLRHGEYHLPAGSTRRDLLALLRSGDTLRYRVTLPEGITLAQAVGRLQEAPALRAVLSGSRDPQLLALIAPYSDGEGLFLPDTYQYQRGDSDLDVLTQAYRLMQSHLTDLWETRRRDLLLASPYEALILASIVERETGVARERARIAGVFLRRLQRGMRLQTDPSVIYGLGTEFDGNLTRRQLRDSANPYNTYRHDGLPPTPIALPGRAALRAVFEPADGSALYFVARGDGSHAFSDTLAAHQKAVREFQLQRRADYRSSPRGAER